MKYINAAEILPDKLVREIQKCANGHRKFMWIQP